MINSRQKGASGEREWINLMKDELGFDLRRNLDQTREGGHDVLGLPGWAPEIKRTKDWTWSHWRQTVRQAEAIDSRPVLVWRPNRAQWQHFCILTAEEFALVVREGLK